MELRSYLGMLKRRGIFVVLVMVAAVGVVMAGRFLQDPTYTASAKVRVILDPGIADFRLNQDYNTRLLNTYTGVVESDLILSKVVGLHPNQLTVTDLRSKTNVQVIPDSEFISIAVQDSDPSTARDLANDLAAQLIAYTQGLYAGDTKSTVQIVQDQLASLQNDLDAARQKQAGLLASSTPSAEAAALADEIRVKTDAYDAMLSRYETAQLNDSLRANSVSVVTPANSPTLPSNASKPIDVALGLAVGLLGGLLLALLLEKLDTRIHTKEQLEMLTSLPVLATVSGELLSTEQLQQAGKGSARVKRISEEYRRLGVLLRGSRTGDATGRILITSAVARQCKSAVAANLARTMADLGNTLFLVESDLWHPAIDTMFETNNGFSLSSAFDDHVMLDGASLESLRPDSREPNLKVIRGGTPASNPSTLLASPAMNRLLTQVSDKSDLTLLDSPPVLNAVDALLIAPQVDGVVVVLRQSSTRRGQVTEAIRQLMANKAQVLGFVFVRKSRRNRAWD